MHSDFTPVPTAPLSLLLNVLCSVLEHSVFYSPLILEDDQAPTFSGFSNPFPAWIVHDRHNSFFNRHFNKTLQLEPSSTSQKAFKFDSIHLTDPTAFLSRLALTLPFSSTLQLMPSFNRDGRRLCSAAMLEPVWICHGPLTSFSRKLASCAKVHQTLVHDRRRSSREGRLCFAAIRRHSSRHAYPTAIACINRAKLTKVKTKKRMDTLSHACTCKPAFKFTVSADINSSLLSEFGRRL
jgi:hypothetical protein